METVYTSTKPYPVLLFLAIRRFFDTPKLNGNLLQLQSISDGKLAELLRLKNLLHKSLSTVYIL